MKIVTYNLRAGGKGRVHWNEILEQFSPEILLVQESSAPVEHLPPLLHGERHKRGVWAPVEGKSRKTRWGSGVHVESNVPTELQLPTFLGSVVGAEVDQFHCPSGVRRTLRAFSIHAPSGTGASYAKTVNKILDMLLEYRSNCELVIGGDFNLTISERHGTDDQKIARADLAVQARLRDEFGLINCWRTANPGLPLAQTLRWSSNPLTPYHCDGLFVPASWSPYLRSCKVLTGPTWDALSDHNPVIAEFI